MELFDGSKKDLYIKENESFIEHDFKILEEIAEETEKIFYDILEFTYKIITVIGLVAGFGFTGLNYVKTMYYFLIGEMLFFLSIGFGIFWIKCVYINIHTTYADYIKNLGECIDNRSKLYDKIFKVHNDDFQSIKEQFNVISEEEVKIFNKRPKIHKTDKINIMLYLFISGGVIILSSFLDLPELILKFIK